MRLALQKGPESRHRDAEGLYPRHVTRRVHPEGSEDPNAAKLFLDYLLSKRAQTIAAGADRSLIG
jgi:hypothetical protein